MNQIHRQHKVLRDMGLADSLRDDVSRYVCAMLTKAWWGPCMQ